MTDYQPTPEDHAEVDAILDELRDDLAAGRLSPEEIDALEAIEPGLVASLSAPAGLNGHAHANGSGFSYDLSNAADAIDLAADRTQQRLAEDAEPQPSGTEARLTRCYDRIARGTFAPAAFEFAGGAARLAVPRQAPLARNTEDYRASVTGSPACGTVDVYGRCSEPFHSAGCGSIADPEVARKLIDNGAYRARTDRQWADDSGSVFRSQWDTPMDLAQLLESQAGERLAGSASGPFESGDGPRELLLPQRHQRFGDPDDPEGYDAPMPAGHQLDRAALAGQAGITSRRRARSARRQGRARAPSAQLNPRWQDPGTGESMAERAGADHRPASAGQDRPGR